MRVEPAKRRRIGVGLVALVAMFTTAACAQGQHAATAQESPAIDGANASIGTMDLRAVAIEAPTGGPSYAAGSAAELKLVLVNTGRTDDTLVGVSTSGAANVSLYAGASDAAVALTASPSVSVSPSASPSISAPSSSASASASSSAASSSAASSSVAGPAPLTSLAVPAGQRVSLGISDSDKVLVISGLLKPLYPGTTLSLTFNFQSAGSITIAVPVQLTIGASPLVIPPLSASG